MAGAVIGGTAVYFLDPDSGEERRKKVTDLVS
ncbi:MAG: YtxH domain-containing protein [Solirubrobacterales bacterium]|nr:YtxH domain-containing protein [Solirubrobacterales bacterium]